MIKNKTICQEQFTILVCALINRLQNHRIPTINRIVYLSFILIIPVIAFPQSQRQCSYTSPSIEQTGLKNTVSLRNEETLYIPVVFHIVYESESQNLSDETIYSQLQVINEDFNRKNENAEGTHPEFTPVAASVAVQFYLAEKDGIQGITRTATTEAPFFNDNLHRSATGGQDAWNTGNYLNVWIADLASDIFGYGTAPGTDEFKDGVAIHYEYVGRSENASAPYHLGRTLTHEIGHWLGLDHPWGNGGCDSDDGIEDTPRQANPSAGCNLNQESCGSRDMVQNFMNTSEDACMNLFTLQQAAIMRNTLFTHRANVYTNENVVTTLLQKNREQQQWIIYPNPVRSTSQAFIQFSQPGNRGAMISLVGFNGEKIREWNINTSAKNTAIDLSGLANGIYFIQVYNRLNTQNSTIFIDI